MKIRENIFKPCKYGLSGAVCGSFAVVHGKIVRM